MVQAPGGGTTLEVQATWSGGEAKVLVALAEDRATTRVASGENAGRTLVHVGAVRSMVRLGKAAGVFSGRAFIDTRALTGPAHAVVFVQKPGGGVVLAADDVPLSIPARASTAHGR